MFQDLIRLLLMILVSVTHSCVFLEKLPVYSKFPVTSQLLTSTKIFLIFMPLFVSYFWLHPSSVLFFRCFLPGFRVHGPRPDGPAGIRPGPVFPWAHSQLHASADGGSGLLPQEQLPSQRHQMLQHTAQQQVRREILRLDYIIAASLQVV